ncbi:hypothetical protein N7486_003787 [Penicillium sp. IBT 16267x]|nr:hypothetical protein N7486_003787 [Penicillium sp. IBT 16267x]
MEPLELKEDEPDPSTDNSQQLQTKLQVQAPRDINLNISTENILTGRRERSPRQDSDYITYFTTAPELEDQPEVLAAFSAATANAKPENLYHRSERPPPPTSLREMQRHPHQPGFLAAASKEVNSLREIGTFEETKVPEPQRRHLTKRAATLATRLARAVFAFVAAFRWNMRQADAINAFLNSFIDEEVYTQMPEETLTGSLRPMAISTSMHIEERRVLTKLGLKQIPDEPCLFGKEGIIVFFYVDDIIIANAPDKQQEADDLFHALEKEWPLRDLRDAQWSLGIRILRDRQQGKL